jgi:GNAT superfamily N-acetyltransferase
LQSGILQVKHAHRGKGIGRKMVAHCVQLARKQGECLLHIQCKPSSSILFWQRMGFTLAPDSSGRSYAIRILEKPLAQLEGGTPVNVVIRFYPEERNRPFIFRSTHRRRDLVMTEPST